MHLVADAEIRALERAAKTGDADALARLKAARERAGRCPDCGGTHAKPDTTSCRERGFLRVLREIMSATSVKELQHARWEAEAAMEGPQPLVTQAQADELLEAFDVTDRWLRDVEAVPVVVRLALAALIQGDPPWPGENWAAALVLRGRRWPKRADPHAEGTRARSCRACRAALGNDLQPYGGRWAQTAKAALAAALKADPCPARAAETATAARPWWAKASAWADRVWERERRSALAKIGAQRPRPRTEKPTSHDTGPLFDSRPHLSDAYGKTPRVADDPHEGA